MAFETFTFEIPGEPVAKGRPRVTTINGHARAYTPTKTANYEALVALAAQTAGCPHYDGPLGITIYAYWEWPKSSWRKREHRGVEVKGNGPDSDNVGKAILDGLIGVAYANDSQVADLEIRKRYAKQGDAAKAVVQIRELTEQRRATA